ncbi:aspartyl-phosphate phosphatase Spo0E family protein [Paenibacillus sp. LjRoot153]
MDKVLEIEIAIESKRNELNYAGKSEDLCSDAMLRLSQELDDLIIELLV